MPTDTFHRNMIVQSMDKSQTLAYVLLTNLTDEQLQAGPQPAMCTPECTPVPLTKSLEELWSEKASGCGRSRGLEMTDCEERDVRIISDARSGTEYNFVGLVNPEGHYDGADEVHCYNKAGKCEDGDEYNLYSYPEERGGWLAIWRGNVTPILSGSPKEAAQYLRTHLGITTDLDPQEVFVLNIQAWVNPGTEAVI